MVAVFSRFVAFTNRHPIVRGMISFGTLWPTSSLIQQTIAGKTIENYDWKEVLRFSLYGGFFSAPLLYGWVRLLTKLGPGTSFSTSVTKAAVEQFTFAPVLLTCFFFGMSLLEGKSVHESKQAVEQKLLPTWKVGACIWPFLQIINFQYIPEKNRVPFVAACSLVWCCFLAYMHQLEPANRKLNVSERLLGNTQG